MRLFVGGVVVLVLAKYATSQGWHLGIIGSVCLWALLAWWFPKTIASPLHLARKHGKRILRASLHRRVAFPFAGWLIYLNIPLATPLFLAVWVYCLVWRKRRSTAKGKYRPLGKRHSYIERKKLNALRQRTRDHATQVLANVALVQTPPRHPCHQWELKLTGSSRGKSPLGTRHFLPYTRSMYYML